MDIFKIKHKNMINAMQFGFHTQYVPVVVVLIVNTFEVIYSDFVLGLPVECEMYFLLLNGKCAIQIY